ncbi:hypothetical protein AAVH_24809, partial [Aphelenchoides avenae]
YIDFKWYRSSKVGVAADVQACLDAAYAASPTFWAISFDNATGECHYLSDPDGTWPRPSGEQPNYWLRIDLHMDVSAVTACLTDQDTRYLLAQMVFDGPTCQWG